MPDRDKNNAKKVDKLPAQKAVALTYKKTDFAPSVLAKGRGYVAQNMIERAKEKNIQTYQDAELVNELTQIDLGMNIPPELYEAVASVLLFIGELEKKSNGY